MEYHRLITLDFIRDNGRHETVKLHNQTLTDARNSADRVFSRCDGIYVEAEISTDRGYHETVFNLYATVDDLRRI